MAKSSALMLGMSYTQFLILCVMTSVILGLFIGGWATKTGIRLGSYGDIGYYYMLPSANVFVLHMYLNNTQCSGMAFKSDKYFNEITINQTEHFYEMNLNGARVGGCFIQ